MHTFPFATVGTVNFMAFPALSAATWELFQSTRLRYGTGWQGCAIVERVMTKLRQGQRPKNHATTICGRRYGHDPQKSHWRAQPVSKNSRRGAPVKEAERRLRPFRLRRVPGRSAWDARECAESAQS